MGEIAVAALAAPVHKAGVFQVGYQLSHFARHFSIRMVSQGLAGVKPVKFRPVTGYSPRRRGSKPLAGRYVLGLTWRAACGELRLFRFLHVEMDVYSLGAVGLQQLCHAARILPFAG